jgi:Holliday junction DNA helicase RuvB
MFIMPAERILAPMSENNETSFEGGLRPRSFNDYVGQETIVNNLHISIEAAKKRDEALDHVLLNGPPGLGKTTLALIVAAEMGVSVRVASGPSIARAGDLAAILSNLQPYDVLFIDEFHRLPKVVEEILYPVMEDNVLDIMVGKGPGAHSVRLSLPPFTLVAATTRYALLSAPLRDRFGSTYRLEYYSTDEIASILTRSSSVLGVKFDKLGIFEIAKRSRNTPRIANRLLRRVRDYAEVIGDGNINLNIATEALKSLGIDDIGLDGADRLLLNALVKTFYGRPVGLETLASSISEEPDTVMEVYEPYLLQIGFLQRTTRGRVATKRAFEHLGVSWIGDDSEKIQRKML